MTLLCMEYKTITVPYFLDEMQYYELQILMENINVAVKNDWLMTREVMWSNLSVWSKKKLKADDIMKLPWDGKELHNNIEEVTENTVDRMKQLSEDRKSALLAAGII